MRRILLIASLATVAGCFSKEAVPVQQDKFVKFTSHLGTSFVAPSQWTTTDEGDTFTLTSPDGYAAITAIVYTSEGSGSLDEFRETMTTGLLPKEASRWKDSQWNTIELGEFKASRRVLIAVPEDGHEWTLYVIDGGKYYHAIFLNSPTAVMSLNGDFYESIVRTFEGIRG